MLKGRHGHGGPSAGSCREWGWGWVLVWESPLGSLKDPKFHRGLPSQSHNFWEDIHSLPFLTFYHASPLCPHCQGLDFWTPQHCSPHLFQ